MKKILNDWRKFVVNERKSDLAYNIFISFVLEEIIKNWRDYYNLELNPTSRTVFALYFKYQKTDEVYQKYIQFFEKEQTDPEQKVEPMTSEFVSTFFDKLFFSFADAYHRPDAAAEMGDNGEMKTYLTAAESKQLYKMDSSETSNLSLTPVSAKDVKSLEPQDKSMVADIIDNIFIKDEGRKSNIVHEIGHFFNVLKSGAKAFRTKGSGKQTQLQFHPSAAGGHYYANSTEEVQARMLAVINYVLKQIKKGDSKYLELLNKKHFISFKELLLSLEGPRGVSIGAELFYNQLSSKSNLMKAKNLPPLPGQKPYKEIPLRRREEIKRKVDNRLFDLFDLLKQKYKNAKMV